SRSVENGRPCCPGKNRRSAGRVTCEDKRQAEVPDVYKLEDDTVMQWRNASKSGGETIDIAPGSGGKALKVHLPNE
ncbi:hypothetical protein ABZV41_41315, partial [Streptomyces sp. NPDC005098]|uniref:hypothetical protein n=1 Tax=Streptomyces sp. NPDC005098 TaxID=3154560 RepID=UPI0033AABE4E